MLFPELGERVHKAGRAFETTTSENIIELGKRYRALLEEYLNKLYDHPGRHSLPGPSSSYEAVNSMKQAIQNEIEQGEQERDRVSGLLESFEIVTLEEAIDTLNRHSYEGHDNWELRGGEVRDGSGNSMSFQEAAEIALLLRREEYIAHNKLLVE